MTDDNSLMRQRLTILRQQAFPWPDFPRIAFAIRALVNPVLVEIAELSPIWRVQLLGYLLFLETLQLLNIDADAQRRFAAT